MDNLSINATKRTPAINFDFVNHRLSMTGESYPEDVNQFYGEVITSLESYLSGTNDQEICFTFELIYFNSSSAKAMIRMFDMLDQAAEKNKVLIQWLYAEDDDNMAELGEEFGEDLTKAKFAAIIKPC